MKQTPEPSENLEINTLIENCLAGEFHREQDSDGLVRNDVDEMIHRLCLVVDNPAVIAQLIRSLLREEIESNYLKEQTREIGDRQCHPMSTVYDGENITKHPDAKATLVGFLKEIEIGVADELVGRGVIDESEVADIDDEISEDPTTYVSEQTALKLERRAGKAGDNAEQWRKVIKSFINTAPARDYQAEYFKKAHARWLEGVVTNGDITFGFNYLVDFTADPKLITLLVTEMQTKGVTLQKLRADILNLKNGDQNEGKQNSPFWLKTIEDMQRKSSRV
jgi:hypothetical protein